MSAQLAEVHPYVLQQTPSVLSVGLKCMKEGCDFVWRASKMPYFRKPDGKKINLASHPRPVPPPAKTKRLSRPEGQIGESSVQGSIPAPSASADVDPQKEYTPSIAPADASEANVIEALLAGGPGDEASHNAEQPIEDNKDLAGQDVVGDPDKATPRSLAESALKQEARTRRHLMIHQPKNILGRV